MPKEQRDDLSEIWGEELLGLESENTSDLERQNVVGKPMVSAPSLEEFDVIHEKMMELEPLLEASGERNLRSIDLTHGDCPRHCLPDLGCRRNQVVGTTRASTKSDHLGGEHNAGSTMDGRKHSKVSRIEDANSRVDSRDRLQQET